MTVRNLAVFFVLTFGFTVVGNIQGVVTAEEQNPTTAVTRAYRFYKDINTLSISVPTVVEVSLANEFIERFDFAVLDKTTDSFEPYHFKQETFVNEIPVSVRTNPNTVGAGRMVDKDTKTYADFSLPENAHGRVDITLLSPSAITSSSISVVLEKNVALPTFVEIRALVGSQNQIIVARRKMDQHTIRFPQTKSSEWYITFMHGQPLRLSELRLHQDNATKSSTRAIRFLAQPSHSYRVYFDPDRSAVVSVGEAGNLVSAQDVHIVPAIPSENNPNYIIADVDNDGVPDIRDNCVSVPNADQQDVNSNGRGDVCDDFDQDGIVNVSDNCPDNPNRDQRDTDGDDVGDVCDEEESRLTERYSWISWVGIGFAASVLTVLFALTARNTFMSNRENNQK